MKRRFVLVAMIPAILIGRPVHAQDRAPSLFTESSIRRIVERENVSSPRTGGQVNDWMRLGQLVGKEVLVYVDGGAGVRARIVSVDDTSVRVRDVDGSSSTPRTIARADVDEIKQWTGRRGSVLGGIAGGAAGGFAGLYTFMSMMYKQCGRSCADEEFFAWSSLIGMPVGGALLGYHLAPGQRTLTTIYRRTPSAGR